MKVIRSQFDLVTIAEHRPRSKDSRSTAISGEDKAIYRTRLCITLKFVVIFTPGAYWSGKLRNSLRVSRNHGRDCNRVVTRGKAIRFTAADEDPRKSLQAIARLIRIRRRGKWKERRPLRHASEVPAERKVIRRRTRVPKVSPRIASTKLWAGDY